MTSTETQMRDALAQCQRVLASLIDPKNSEFRVSAITAFANIAAAEANARKVLGKAGAR